MVVVPAVAVVAEASCQVLSASPPARRLRVQLVRVVRLRLYRLLVDRTGETLPSVHLLLLVAVRVALTRTFRQALLVVRAAAVVVDWVRVLAVRVRVVKVLLAAMATASRITMAVVVVARLLLVETAITGPAPAVLAVLV